MKARFFITITLCIFLSNCDEHKYKFTVDKICDRNLYIEVYAVNSLGLNADYLTDSINFRIFVGEFDSEHDHFTYECNGDSIYITKVLTGNKNCRWVTTKDGFQTVLCDSEYISRKPISLTQLKKERKFD